MLTVREVANKYRVSVQFMIKALAAIGFEARTPETPLRAGVIARFEEEWGDKIRSSRPRPVPGFTAESDTTPISAPGVRQSAPHVMRIAHAAVEGKRDEQGHKVKALLENPGVVHAIDAAGTQDGDPWRGLAAPGAVHFYGGGQGNGPYAACHRTRVRAVLGDEFDPNDETRNLCPVCAELVADGKGFRSAPHERRNPFCEDYLRLRMDGEVVVEKCTLRAYHSGPHRAFDGAMWLRGFEDYKPAEADAGRRITEAR